MRRWAIYILVGFAVSLTAAEWQVPCGARVELRATANDGWRFDHWSDGSTDSVRQLEVTSNLDFIAYFSPACDTYVLPATALYDWLIMLDIRTIQAEGYFFEPEQVTWYRAGDEPEPVATGYYLTLGRSLVGTGSYYAEVTGEDATGLLCPLRSQMISCGGPAPSNVAPLLEPTVVHPHESQTLRQLNPDKSTQVTIFSINGQRIRTLSSDGVERMSLQAEGVAGCYQVVVQNGEEKHVLRYIVVK